MSINGEKVLTPLRLAAREVTYTSIELERSQKYGQPLDEAKLVALNLMYQMNIDQMVYVGSTDVSQTGLFNNSGVTVTNAPNGASASPLWSSKTPAEILADVNAILTNSWIASGYALAPTSLRLPPAQFAQLASTIVSSAGNQSVLSYLSQNAISNNINGSPLDIAPSKWLVGAGAGGTNRIVAYTNDESRVSLLDGAYPPRDSLQRRHSIRRSIRIRSRRRRSDLPRSYPLSRRGLNIFRMGGERCFPPLF